MFTGFSSKGMGLVTFTLLYVVYVIGYTTTNMTAQTIPAIMTNDPRQRPTLGVWTTAFNYLVPMVMSMVLNVVLLPKCGGTYNQAFLTAACNITLIVAAIGTLLVCLGVSAFDKPENFVGTKKAEPLKMADIVEVLKHNKPLQCYIASNASDKLAQQVGSQAIINTILGGIIIGNIALGTILTVISMVRPSSSPLSVPSMSASTAAKRALSILPASAWSSPLLWSCSSLSLTPNRSVSWAAPP